jgi:HD-like signal output (HDOD) protein
MVCFVLMTDDLFKGKRFKPGPARIVDDDSGLAYRQAQATAAVRIPEEEMLAAVDLVPPLPAVVNSILAQVGSNHSSAADLEGLIKKDMVIAGRLLKMVNSPFYALTNPVASITQAVAIIGFASLRSMVLAASAANLLVSDLSAYGFTTQGLWKNSIATAALAREIGRRTGMTPQQAEENFVAGLLRDVGMLVLGPMLATHQISLRRVPGDDQDILTRERKTLGYDHCWVGDRIAEKWRLPRGIVLAISKHHRVPSLNSAGELRQLSVVLVAERLVYAALGGVIADHPFDSRLDSTLIQSAGIDAGVFQQLVELVPGIIAAAETSLV